MKEKRFKYFVISRELFSEFFKDKTRFEVCDGLPQDSEILDISYVSCSDTYRITVFSKKFKVLEEAEIIPKFESISFKNRI